MVEETTAASQVLASESRQLLVQIERFRLEDNRRGEYRAVA
nr:hypothetical protein [Agrobacterium vitis]